MNFCCCHDFELDPVIEQINTNDVVAACFAVNPNKQDFYEKVAADFIRRIDGVVDFQNLPNNALSVLNGGVFPKKKLTELGGVSGAKTIDFQWKYGGVTFYASHKYTKERGGSQESAYKDLQNFISESANTTLRETFFIAIADGDYYLTENGQAGTRRIDRLEQLASSDKVHACTIDELEGLMKRLVR